MEIQDYNLTIKHISGKIHTAPDMLSRPPGVDQGKQDNTDIVLLPLSMFIATSNIQDDMLQAKVKVAQQKQKGEMELWCDTQGVHKLPEGYAKEWRLAVPLGLVLRQELMVQFHNSPMAGHPREGQHSHPHISALLVARNECMGRMIHSRMRPMPTKQDMHHQKENSPLSHSRRLIDAPL